MLSLGIRSLLIHLVSVEGTIIMHAGPHDATQPMCHVFNTNTTISVSLLFTSFPVVNITSWRFRLSETKNLSCQDHASAPGPGEEGERGGGDGCGGSGAGGLHLRGGGL